MTLLSIGGFEYCVVRMCLYSTFYVRFSLLGKTLMSSSLDCVIGTTVILCPTQGKLCLGMAIMEPLILVYTYLQCMGIEFKFSIYKIFATNICLRRFYYFAFNPQ